MDSFKKGFSTVLGVFAGLWTVELISRVAKQYANKIEKEEVKPEKSKEDLWEESVK